jgi:hypothetical protein
MHRRVSFSANEGAQKKGAKKEDTETEGPQAQNAPQACVAWRAKEDGFAKERRP